MPKPDSKELARLAKLEAAQVAAKRASLAKPKSAGLKKAYVKATLAVGKAYMTTPAVAPRVKYPKSLRYYREARKADPKNAEAIEAITMMEGIYRSMGRPIPPS